MFDHFDLMRLILNMGVFIPAITLHEFCHAKFADLAGDMTPRSQGRVTLNPLAHLDPIGTIMMVVSSITGFGIGWGKPVMVNVGKMKNPRWDHFISVVMGPVSNLGIALVCAILLRMGMVSLDTINDVLQGNSIKDYLGAYIFLSFLINMGLFFFNLIPIGPLDGHWLVGAFLPPVARNNWYRFCHGPGTYIFLILILVRTNAFDPIGSYMSFFLVHSIRFVLGI